MLIVSVLVVIAVAAAVDALRGDEEAVTEGREPQQTSTRETRTERSETPAEVLTAAGVTGTLYFTLQADEGCFLHTLALPGLEGANAFLLDRCEFDVSPRGDVVSGGPCPATDIQLRPVGGPPRHLRGCAPAWTPDGELTYVRDGDVLTLGGGTSVHDPGRFAENALGQSRKLLVRQLAWLSHSRLAALISGRRADPGVVIVIEGGHVVSEPLFVGSGDTMHVLRYSEEIFVSGQVFDSRGNFVTANRFPFGDVAAVADSPQQRWFAVARPGSVCIYQDIQPPPRERFPITCLEINAVDMAWG
jgi:hypothetical protein